MLYSSIIAVGREVRFIIAKADMASHSQIISMFGQLLWVLSPIMSHERPPMVYALSSKKTIHTLFS